MSQAYWGPQMRLGLPQTALNVNLDTWTNVESLNFRYEPQTSVLPIVFIQDPLSKVNIPIPIPPVTPFNPPLGLAVPVRQKIEPISETAKLNPAQAFMRGFARSVETADVVTGEGIARRHALWPAVARPQPGWRPRRGPALGRHALRGLGHPSHQAGRVQGEFRVEAQCAHCQYAGGAVAAVLSAAACARRI